VVDEEWPLAEELARMPDVVLKLLATHVDDGERRCRGCRSQVRLAPEWPCTLHAAATAAARFVQQCR
jgi:hypothetical protein